MTRKRLLRRSAAALAVLLFLGLVARFWHPAYGFTAFFQLDAPNDDVKIAAFREHPVHVYRDTGGYDGLYYAQIAHDPLLRSPALPRALDNANYRARRILPPATAWLLGGGHPAGILLAYSLLNVAAWLGLAVVLWRLLEPDAEATPWTGLAAWAGVLFSAGALSSVRLALTDLPALLLLAGALLLAERARPRSAAATLALAGLARETSLLATAGLVTRPWVRPRNALLAAGVALPLAAWLAYLRGHLGPADAGWANFDWPVAGLLEKVRDGLAAPFTLGDAPLAWTSLLGTVGILTQAAFLLARWRLADAWWRIGAAYTGMMLCLGTAVWEGFPGAATRVLLPLQLAFNVVAVRSRAGLLILLLGNLSVGSGLLALRDVPRDPAELAAASHAGRSAVLRLGTGWYAPERDARQTWAWTAGTASLDLEVWPRTEATVTLHGRLRALGRGQVVVRLDGREVGRLAVDTTLAPFSLPVTIPGGRGRLEFRTDLDAQPESAAPGARRLAFALYRAELAL